MKAFLKSVDITNDMCALGWWDEKCRYWSVCVGFLYVDVDKDPSCWHVILTSINEIDASVSLSHVSRILLLTELIVFM